MPMYGKKQPSSGEPRNLRVQESMAEVYTIDALAAGAPLDHGRMANLLGLTEEIFERARTVITAHANSKLITIRDELSRYFSYNRIRFCPSTYKGR